MKFRQILETLGIAVYSGTIAVYSGTVTTIKRARFRMPPPPPKRAKKNQKLRGARPSGASITRFASTLITTQADLDVFASKIKMHGHSRVKGRAGRHKISSALVDAAAAGQIDFNVHALIIAVWSRRRRASTSHVCGIGSIELLPISATRHTLRVTLATGPVDMGPAGVINFFLCVVWVNSSLIFTKYFMFMYWDLQSAAAAWSTARTVQP